MSKIFMTNREDKRMQTSSNIPANSRQASIQSDVTEPSFVKSAPCQLNANLPPPSDKRPRTSGSSSETVTLQTAKRSKISSSNSVPSHEEVIGPLMSLNLSGNNGNDPKTTSNRDNTSEERDPDVENVTRSNTTDPIQESNTPESGPHESEDLEKEDPYQSELPPHLLAYYKPSRKATLATARTSERVNFYKWCKEQNVTLPRSHIQTTCPARH